MVYDIDMLRSFLCEFPEKGGRGPRNVSVVAR